MHYYPTNTNSNQRGLFSLREKPRWFQKSTETVDYLSVSNKDAYQSQLFLQTKEQS
jgi:hypothetical protein